MATAFGDRVRGHRLSRGLSQDRLAAAAGMAVRTLRDIEQGRVRRPRARSVRDLAAALELAPAERDELVAAAGGTAGAVEVAVLGPLEVRRAGLPAVPVRRLPGTLLGLLAIQAGRVVPRDELVDVLWGEEPPPTSRDLLRAYAGQVRALLGGGPGLLAVSAAGYRLHLAAGRLDLGRFEELAERGLAAGRAGDRPEAARLLAEALGLWRGPVLAGAGSRVRLHPAVVALDRRRVEVALAYADLTPVTGRADRAVAVLAPVAAAEPLHEGLQARLVLALAAAGDQAGALRLHAAVRRRLGDELGVTPGAELAAAHLTVLRSDRSDRSDRSAAVRAAARLVPAELPADIGAFSGRDAELAGLDRLLAAAPAGAPLVAVLSGPAGVGKTALAVHWAHRVQDRFPDGQLHVDLRGWAAVPPLRPVQALGRLLGALGLAPEQVPEDEEGAAGRYRSVLAGRRVLVLLDDARHAEQVRPLLPGTPGCLVVVTSRDLLAGLAIREGAYRMPVGVLTEAGSVRLLAAVLGPDRVAAEPATAAELAGLCGHLPLALRVAAANLDTGRHASLAEAVAVLRTGDRLAALEVDGDPRAAVRAAFALSYRALPEPEQRLFRLAGTAPVGSLTAPAAAVLLDGDAAAAGRGLDRLAAAHLLERRGPGRFGCHDLLRLYAAGLGGADPAAADRLGTWYLDRVTAAVRLLAPEKLRLPAPETPAGQGFPDHPAALSWLDGERANLVALAASAAEHGPPELAYRLADALRGYFWLRMHVADWLAVSAAGLAAAERTGDARAAAACWLGLADAAMLSGRHAAAIERYAEAHRLAERSGWESARSAVLGNLGNVHWRCGRLAEAAEHFERALAIDRRSGWLAGQAVKLGNLGSVHRAAGRLAESARHHRQALALERRTGSVGGQAVELADLGEVLALLGRPRQGDRLLVRALRLLREVGDRASEAETLRLRAAVHVDAGAPTAAELATAAVALARETGERRVEADALNVLGRVLAGGPDARAAHEQALRLSRDVGGHYPEAEALLGIAAADRRAGALAPARHGAAGALDLARDRSYGLVEAAARTELSAVALAAGQPAAAAGHAGEALATAERCGHRLGAARALVLLARAERSRDPAAAVAAAHRGARLAVAVGGLSVPLSGNGFPSPRGPV